LRLDFINGKPKKAVENLVSLIRPATLNSQFESKLEMDKSDLKKDFLEFVAYLEKIDIIHDEIIRIQVTLARRTREKVVTLTAEVLDITMEDAPLGVAVIRRLSVIERSLVLEDRRTRVALESLLRGSLRLPCLSNLSDCPHTSKD
jgi:hypothetical protein